LDWQFTISSSIFDLRFTRLGFRQRGRPYGHASGLDSPN